MSIFTGLLIAWGVVTIALVALLIYRSRLTKGETDWIPLTDDAKEEKAIQAQTASEMKTRKLALPIRALWTLFVLMLLVILGFWLYQGITTQPPPP